MHECNCGFASPFLLKKDVRYFIEEKKSNELGWRSPAGERIAWPIAPHSARHISFQSSFLGSRIESFVMHAKRTK